MSAGRGPRRDLILWGLAVLAVIAVAAQLVAAQEYDGNGAADCYPGCSFGQDLSNAVAGGAPAVAFVIALVGLARATLRRAAGAAQTALWGVAALAALVWILAEWSLLG